MQVHFLRHATLVFFMCFVCLTQLQTHAQLVSEIPTKVVVSTDGSTRVYTKPLEEPLPRTSSLLPITVPVETVLPDGSVIPGLPMLRLGVLPPVLAVPHAVFLAEDGSYRMIERMLSLARVGGECTQVSIPQSERISVFYATVTDGPERPISRRGPAWDLRISSDLFADPNLGPTITRITGSIEDRMERLLAFNAGSPRWFILRTPLPQGTIATTATFSFGASYNIARTLLNEYVFIDGEGGAEVSLYDNLPFGTSLPCYLEDNTPTQPSNVSGALILDSLAQRYGFPSFGDYDFITAVNSTAPFDSDRRDGIVPNSNELELTLQHELIHGLGFTSQVDSQQNQPAPLEYVQMWDFFRLAQDDGPVVTLFEFFSQPRQLRFGVESISDMAAGIAEGTKRMSTGPLPTGDGGGGDHWKALSLLQLEDPFAVRIGIMDPFLNPGALRRQIVGKNDIRTLDIIGWNIDNNAGPLVLADPVITSPAGGAMASTMPNIAWSADSAASNFCHVFIFQDNPSVEDNRVFSETRLSPIISQLSVPGGILRPATNYVIVVSAENDFELGISSVAFSTLGLCIADWNTNGLIESDDIFAFLNHWFASFPATDLDDDGDFVGCG